MTDRSRDDPPRKRKRRPPAAKTGSIDVVRALTAVGAALLLFLVSYGFGQGTRFVRTALIPREVAAADSSPNQPNGPAPIDNGSKEPVVKQPSPRGKPGPNANTAKPSVSADLGMPRPQVRPGDRSAVKKVEPAQPLPWSIPEEKVPPSEPLMSAIDVAPGDVFFSAAQAGQAAVLALRRHDTPHSRLASTWSRVDLRTGKRLGEGIELWPWFNGAEDATLNPPPTGWALAALSADGSQLALRDPASRGRLDVWDSSGARLLSLTPYDPASALEWLGWSADGRLLTIGEGRLTAWDIPDGRAVYEIFISGSNLAAVLSPGRTWIAVATKGGVYLFDTAAGRCLGHLETGDPAAEGWIALAIAPDGQRLCGIIRRRPPPFAPSGIGGWMTRWNGKERAGELVWSSLYDIYTWDLQSGKLTGSFPVWTDVASPQWNPLHWCGPNHILIGGRNLVDLEHRVLLRAYLASRAIVPESPDGRLWYLSAATQPGAKVAPLRAYRSPSPLADAKVVFHPGTPVVVAAECGNPDRDKLAVTALRSLLDHEGYKDGPGAWTMRLKAEPFDTRERLPQEPADAPTLPAILITIRLITPNGTEAGSEAYSAVFPRKRSKYYVRPRAGESDTVEKYNFGGKDRNQAILEEIWEQLATPGAWARWPRGVVKVQDKFLLLPQADDLVPD
ncbi:MAG TPA: hypothetical protein VGG61_16510 [Gemmataceae bacterium]